MRRTVPAAGGDRGADRPVAGRGGVGEDPRESLSELARLGARLIIQRAVEVEFDACSVERAMSAAMRPVVGSTTRATNALAAAAGASSRGSSGA